MTQGEIEISVTEFKAKCLGLLDRLSSRKLKRITILKRGKPVAIMTRPPAVKKSNLEAMFADMKGRTVAPPGFDCTQPVFDEDWDAEKGILHR